MQTKMTRKKYLNKNQDLLLLDKSAGKQKRISRKRVKPDAVQISIDFPKDDDVW